MKKYKLLKDLPTFKAGDMFTLSDNGCLYLSNGQEQESGRFYGMSMSGHWKTPVMAYHKNTLRHFPNILRDWFEEVKEPKDYWYLDCDGEIQDSDDLGIAFDRDCKQIGNYFTTKEEAEETLEKLKAYKRLKDKGFEFKWWVDNGTNPDYIQFRLDDDKWDTATIKDLNLVFGGEDAI